jgi:hypothetical protein
MKIGERETDEFNGVAVENRPAVRGNLPTGMQGISCIGTEEPPADIRPRFVDGAAPIRQKFASVVDLQFVRTVKRQLQPPGTQTMKPPVLVPADLDGGKRAAAGATAFLTAIVVVTGCIEKESVVSFLSEGREEHRCSFS